MTSGHSQNVTHSPITAPFRSGGTQTTSHNFSPTLFSTTHSHIPTRISVRHYTPHPIRSVTDSNLISIPLKSSTFPPSVPTPSVSQLRIALLNIRSLNLKSNVCNNFITSNKIDILVLTETWLKPDDFDLLNAASPPTYSHLQKPRISGRVGGGLAVIFNIDYTCSSILFGDFLSFEYMAFTINKKHPTLFIAVYRPPKPNSSFIPEFSELLSMAMSKYSIITLLGDFNVHVCCPKNPLAKEFRDIIESFDFVLHPSGPTHNKGHTLDLVLTTGLKISQLETIDFYLSDHKSLVFSIITAPPPRKTPTSICSRILTPLTSTKFTTVFDATATFPAPSLSTDDQLTLFNKTCKLTLDLVAPFKTRTKLTDRPSPWLTDHTRALKRELRKIERKWKSTKLSVFYERLKDLMRNYNAAVKVARNNYFSSLISNNHLNPRTLFQTIDRVVGAPKTLDVPASHDHCESFLTFFTDKIQAIRSQMPNIHPPSSTPTTAITSHDPPKTSISSLTPIPLATLLKTISQMKSTSCNLDIVPTHLLKEILPSVGPHILSLVNSSLVSGSVPPFFKTAIVPFYRRFLKRSFLIN